MNVAEYGSHKAAVAGLHLIVVSTTGLHLIVVSTAGLQLTVIRDISCIDLQGKIYYPSHPTHTFRVSIKIRFLALQRYSPWLFAFVHHWHTVVYEKLHTLINQTFWHYRNIHFNELADFCDSSNTIKATTERRSRDPMPHK